MAANMIKIPTKHIITPVIIRLIQYTLKKKYNYIIQNYLYL